MCPPTQDLEEIVRKCATLQLELEAALKQKQAVEQVLRSSGQTLAGAGTA